MVSELGRTVYNVKVITANSYMLNTLRGERLPRALNGRYLKNITQVYGRTLE
jgi:hypothetical protein